jgi:rare lipoprotein A
MDTSSVEMWELSYCDYSNPRHCNATHRTDSRRWGVYPRNMIHVSCRRRLMPVLVLLGVMGATACTHSAPECTAAGTAHHYAQSLPATVKARDVRPDLSGCKRAGVASFYSEMFTGRKMADGRRMDPNDDNAASRTLPLGTTAKVTNLETGRSAEVTIQDRGPYVKGRIIDLSPATAREIGLDRRDGLARVVVAPIEVPLPNGGVKQGAAAGDKTM